MLFFLIEQKQITTKLLQGKPIQFLIPEKNSKRKNNSDFKSDY